MNGGSLVLLELVYKDRFYMAGTAAEIRSRLAEHALSYVTVKELLDGMAPE